MVEPTEEEIHRECILKYAPKTKRFILFMPIQFDRFWRLFDEPIIRFVQLLYCKVVYAISVFVSAITCIEVGISAPVLLYFLELDGLANVFTWIALMNTLTSQLPKRFLWRARPWMAHRATKRRNDNTSSFPSRSVTCAVVYAFQVIYASHYAVRPAETEVRLYTASLSWWMVLLLILLPLASCFSRIALGCHYPSDCLFGLLQGALVILTGTLLAKCVARGCLSCNTGACYAHVATKAIGAHTVDSQDLMKLFLFWLAAAALTTLAVARPLALWAKCHHAFGLLLPGVSFHIFLLCPRFHHDGRSLAPPRAPKDLPWWHWVLALGATGVATAGALLYSSRKKKKRNASLKARGDRLDRLSSDPDATTTAGAGGAAAPRVGARAETEAPVMAASAAESVNAPLLAPPAPRDAEVSSPVLPPSPSGIAPEPEAPGAPQAEAQQGAHTETVPARVQAKKAGVRWAADVAVFSLLFLFLFIFLFALRISFSPDGPHPAPP